MPEIGEIKYGREIGKPQKSEKYTYLECPICKEQKWKVMFADRRPSPYCYKCCHKHKMALKDISEPQLGDIKRICDVYEGRESDISYVTFVACEKCGQPGWVKTRKTGRVETRLCRICALEKMRKNNRVINTTPPVVGEVRRGWQVGRNNHKLYLFALCPKCQKPRWVIKHLYKPERVCLACASRKRNSGRDGEQNGRWTGRWTNKRDGYVVVHLLKDDPFRSIAQINGTVLEHRLVMSKHLGRSLQRWEVVHHKNGIRDDNRIENLELSVVGSHTLRHSKGYKDGWNQGYYDGKDAKIKELLATIRELELSSSAIKNECVQKKN